MNRIKSFKTKVFLIINLVLDFVLGGSITLQVLSIVALILSLMKPKEIAKEA